MRRGWRSLGHVITEDWTLSVQKHGPDEKVPEAALCHAAIRNVDGVRAADLVIVLVPFRRGSIGWSFEMGVAHQAGIDVWWVGRKQSCFWVLSQHTFSTLEGALCVLKKEIVQ